MSISLGLYDLFANTIPGFMYLYLAIEFLRYLGWRTIDITQVDTIGDVLAVIVASFILGNIISSLTFKFWYKVFFRRSSRELSLTRLKKLYSEIKIGFDYFDDELIFAVIKHHDKSLAEKLEATRVNSIMMRNISFGLFIYGIWQIILFFIQGNLSLLAIGIPAILFSAICLSRALTFNKWFFDSVFLEGLNYGSTVSEVLSVSRKIVAGEEVKKISEKLRVRKK